MLARSLTEVVKIVNSGGRVTKLALPASKDLVCVNMWCQKVTGPCICRLERALQTIDPATLEEVDLSANKLTSLPPSLSTLVNLRSIDISSNGFEAKPEVIENLASFHTLQNVVDHSNPYSS